MDTARDRFEFDGFALDRERWTLLDADGAPVAITPKAFDALIYFLKHAGQVIDRATLLDVLWPDTIVEENNLSQVVAALRRALGDESIRTVPRRGYRFVADVKRVAVDPATELTTEPVGSVVAAAPQPDAELMATRALQARPRAGRAGMLGAALLVGVLLVAAIAVALWPGTKALFDTGPERSPRLAVLPFADTSQARDLEPLADAIATELLTTLSLIEGLDVLGRSSSFYFRDHPADLTTIRSMLDVDYLLEGDLRSADDRLRISVRLTDARSGSQIWSESYDRIADDLFELQDDIARATAQALEITLGVGDLGTRLGTTRNPDAFFAFVDAMRILRRGNRFSRADVREAIPHLERAVVLDENFALGWLELYNESRWLDILARDSGGSDPVALARADYALQRVVELTPNLPDLVYARLETSADAHDIARAFEQFLDEASGFSYPPVALATAQARYLWFTGRVTAATAVLEQARVLDPLEFTLIGLLAQGYAAEGRPRDALDLLDEFASISGPSAGIDGAALTIALQLGDATEIADRAARLRVPDTSIVATLARDIDDPDLALRRLREFAAAPDVTVVLWPTMLAPWAAYFGDDELALEMYRHEVAFATGNTISRPLFAGMRRLEGFKDLVRDVGLLSYWRESGNWPDYCRPLERDDFECF